MRPLNRTPVTARPAPPEGPAHATETGDEVTEGQGPDAVGDGGADDDGCDPAGDDDLPAVRELLLPALTVGAAVAAYGLSYGVLAVAAGLSPTLATLSSVFVLAGASQFAFVGVLALGGNPMAGALGGLLLNVRYVAFGLAIARALPGGPLPRRAVDAYLIVDESVALALGRAGPMPAAPAARARWSAEATRRFRVVGWSVVLAWILATAIGAFGGQLIADPEVLGLDAAFPAGFLALLAPWLRSRRGRTAAVTGAVIALALTPIAPPGVPIVAAAVGGLLALAVPPGRGEVAA